MHNSTHMLQPACVRFQQSSKLQSYINFYCKALKQMLAEGTQKRPLYLRYARWLLMIKSFCFIFSLLLPHALAEVVRLVVVLANAPEAAAAAAAPVPRYTLVCPTCHLIFPDYPALTSLPIFLYIVPVVCSANCSSRLLPHARRHMQSV